jgi:uroporphyrin-III C-methyltransferase
LTLKGRDLLAQADVVVYDALVSAPILAMANPQAVMIPAGKRRGYHSLKQPEITRVLVEQAQRYPCVVRLKGGDPFVFGRGGEEMAALVDQGIPVEVVPGITAGVAAPAYAGIPITHRDHSSSVTFVTGHEAAGKYRPDVDWRAIAQGSETIVIYMGIHNMANIVPALLQAQLKPETPVALVRWGTRPEQSVLEATLGTVLQDMTETGFAAPAIAVIGNVVQLRQTLAQCTPVLDARGWNSGGMTTPHSTPTEPPSVVRMNKA